MKMLTAGPKVLCGWVLFSFMVCLQANAEQQSTNDVLLKYGKEARNRLFPVFNEKGLSYPPRQISFLVLKDSATLELWAGPDTNPTFIQTYDVLLQNGVAGSNPEKGDSQIPQGIFEVKKLNPNSDHHLSIRLDYLNISNQKRVIDFDFTIHGTSDADGSLALSDKAIEELFVLSADVGKRSIIVIIAPTDPRENELMPPDHEIAVEFSKYLRSD